MSRFYGSKKAQEREYLCIICGYDRYIEQCHIVPKKLGGGHNPDNIFFMCPNHHKLFDNCLLTKDELINIEAPIMAAINHYHDNLKILQYLYGILRITEPMSQSKRISILKRKETNKYW